MLTNKNSKCLFPNFNDYLNRTNQPAQFIRHRTISDDDFALATLQEKIWPFFIERIIEVSENDSLELENSGSDIDIDESRLIIDTIGDLNICKYFYNIAADNLFKYLIYCPILKRDEVDEDTRINGFFFIDFQNIDNSIEISNAYDYRFIFMVVFWDKEN